MVQTSEEQLHDAACTAMGEAVWHLVVGGGASDVGKNFQLSSGSFRAS